MDDNGRCVRSCPSASGCSAPCRRSPSTARGGPTWSRSAERLDAVLGVPTAVLRLVSVSGGQSPRSGEVTYHVEVAALPVTPIEWDAADAGVLDGAPCAPPGRNEVGPPRSWPGRTRSWHAPGGLAPGRSSRSRRGTCRAYTGCHHKRSGLEQGRRRVPGVRVGAAGRGRSRGSDPRPGRARRRSRQQPHAAGARARGGPVAGRRPDGPFYGDALGRGPGGARPCPVPAPDLRLETLADRVAPVLDRVAGQLTASERDAVPRLLADLPRRIDAIRAAGLPDTLVHGDFHRQLARVRRPAARVVDWADSYLGHPRPTCCDSAPTCGTAQGGADRAWVDAWRDAVVGCDPAAVIPLFAPLVHLHGAYVYQRFLDHISRPSTRTTATIPRPNCARP